MVWIPITPIEALDNKTFARHTSSTNTRVSTDTGVSLTSSSRGS
ncbi:hypothetical protein CCACVL1_13855 [Corchorus capsularis]|uniref:Uncharacterized protein n=1 Tax=Corchorus capsularis TaxID=210143 RepID=A0A1R3I9L3_COCAP|nr:hypothetical protein CCACVL1_13855 [Corchorus capsularis]